MRAKRRHFVKQWDSQKPEERYQVTVTRGGEPVEGIRTELISVIEEDLMYWTQANHIHQWFLTHVQNGIDDEQEHHVSRDQLAILGNTCKVVLAASKLVDGCVDGGAVVKDGRLTKQRIRIPGRVIEDTTVAKQLLPRRGGYWLGSHEYDETYLRDVKLTHDWIAAVFAEPVCKASLGIFYSAAS